MIKQPLVNVKRLHSLIRAGLCIAVDCRFALTDAEQGREDWLESHIPGAMYAHLDEDLASPVTAKSGRHPLPDPDEFAQYLSSIGWTEEKLLVAYDDGSNAIASRLWWLMRYFNQDAALLDGGFAAWTAAGLPVESGPVFLQGESPVDLVGTPKMVVSADDVLEHLSSGGLKLVDARAFERYSGAVEPLDTRAGHIPGALNRPFNLNLDANGCFKKPELLREEFEELFGELEKDRPVHSCGSGVTACHNVFAMELAGLDAPLLYPGSWSEWIRDDSRPVETGAGD